MGPSQNSKTKLNLHNIKSQQLYNIIVQPHLLITNNIIYWKKVDLFFSTAVRLSQITRRHVSGIRSVTIYAYQFCRSYFVHYVET